MSAPQQLYPHDTVVTDGGGGGGEEGSLETHSPTVWECLHRNSCILMTRW